MSAAALQALAIAIALAAILVAAVLAWWQAGRPLNHEMLFWLLLPLFLLSGRPSWLRRSSARRAHAQPVSRRAGDHEHPGPKLRLVRDEADEK